MMFVTKGDIRWGNAWILVFIYTSFSLFDVLMLYKNEPDLLVRRSKVNLKGTKIQDVILFGIYSRIFIIIPTVASFDLFKLHNKEMDKNLFIFGIIILLLSQSLGSLAILSNKYYETYIRIQKEVKQKVITHGPYRFIRHPGYLSLLLTDVAFPLILKSSMSIIPACICGIIIIFRTKIEDIFLRTNLDGYKQYSYKVRYKMIPYVW